MSQLASSRVGEALRLGRRMAFMGAAAIVLAGAASAQQPVLRATTDRGVVEGRPITGGIAFKGIPYAAPPTGPLRWRPPQPASAWRGVFQADRYGPNCPQPTMAGAPAQPQSEACLSLNVFTPSVRAKGLPVLVSIHGGAFFVGSGRLPDAEVATMLRHGVVVVSPNYRLGRLGFFAHPALDHPADGAEIANYWLMDQIAALHWVRRNIARFGGDPDNVTVLGCSAGGSSVAALTASPDARNLFARASVHSGGGMFNATHPLAEAEGQGIAFAEREGIPGTGPQAAVALRRLSVGQVLKGDPGPPDFGPVIDGRLLPDQISVIFAKGEQAHVPFMSGSVSNEASVFGLMGFDKQVLKRRFGVDVDALRAVYDPDGKLSHAELLRQVQTDFIFTSAGLGMAELASLSGQPAYAYYFDYVDAADRGKVPGVPHCGDMPYLLGDVENAGPEDQAISRMMQAYLVNFMRKGNPNGPGLPSWPRMTAREPTPLVIGRQVRAVPGFRARQLAPWYAKWSAEMGRAFPR